jgi:hypothetical protein
MEKLNAEIKVVNPYKTHTFFFSNLNYKVEDKNNLTMSGFHS